MAPLRGDPAGGQFRCRELGAANAAQVALLTAVVAGGRTQQFGTALQRLLGCVDAAQASLTDYERVIWHLKGVAAWRLDDALKRHPCLEPWHRTVQGLDTLPAQAYLGRLFDTFGQIFAAPGPAARRAAGIRTGTGLQTRWQKTATVPP